MEQDSHHARSVSDGIAEQWSKQSEQQQDTIIIGSPVKWPSTR
jgi:hypothetical protein